MNEHLAASASAYLLFLAERFPVMCASDEFHFMPRAAAAAHFYDRLDGFGKQEMEECIEELRGFRKAFDALASRLADPEDSADLDFLRASLAGTLIELDNQRPWQHNPLIYLKVAFIGLDHALAKPASSRKEAVERACARMEAIPRLFRQAAENISLVPESHYGPSLAMASDCREYLESLAQTLPPEEKTLLGPALEKAATALSGFSRFLAALRPVPDAQAPAPDLRVVLEEIFLSGRSPSEVIAIGLEDWNDNLRRLAALAAEIAPGKDWRAIYHEYLPSEAAGMDTIPLYEREIASLRSFFAGRGFGEKGHALPVVLETPAYLRSVRSSASFAAAFTRDDREVDYFYISTRLPRQESAEAAELLRKRLHREYKFLSAHEAFPGHGYLDATRRHLANPVRSQIESPLFYEGWAYYVETLLADFGYVRDPVERLVDCRRRLWRAARCRIDAGLNTGRMDRAGAVALLTTTGFAEDEAVRQVDRFRLNPGYQLCYTLGKYEIMKLREAYGSRLGLDRFHRFILEGGEMPFPVIAGRLERYVAQMKD